MASTQKHKPSYEKEPDKFPWEAPNPTSPFWTGLNERLGQQFLTIYGADGLSKLPLDQSLSKNDKIRQLRQILQDKLAAEQTPPEAMSEEEFKAHRTVNFAVVMTYTDLQEWKAAQDMCRQLSDTYQKRNGRPDVGALNTVAYTAERLGDYAECDQACKESIPLLAQHELLGPESPQVLGTMRLRMLALGKVGRLIEGKELNGDGYRVIEKMKGSKFAKYHDEELEAMDEMRDILADAEAKKAPIPEEWRPLQSD